MLNFEQYTPTRVIFGRETEKRTGKEIAALGGKRVLIVYGGGSVIRSGLMKTVEDSLKAEGLVFEEFGGRAAVRFALFLFEILVRRGRLKLDARYGKVDARGDNLHERIGDLVRRDIDALVHRNPFRAVSGLGRVLSESGRRAKRQDERGGRRDWCVSHVVASFNLS